MQKNRALVQTALFMLWTVLGIGLAYWLTRHYYDLRGGTAEFKSICNFGERMSCDAVAASRYSDIFFGFPVSSVAAGFYLGLFLIAAGSLRASWRSEGRWLLLLLTSGGIVFSLGLLFIMAFMLKIYCLFCLGLDLIGLLSFATAIWIWRSEPLAKPSAGNALFFLAIVAGSVAIAVTGLDRMYHNRIDPQKVRGAVDKIMAAAPVTVAINDDDASFGPKNAPITVIEFSDFQCPFCRMASKVLNSVMARYPGQIHVVFKNFPLDNSCALWMGEHQMHPMACEAAREARCAWAQGKFEPMYEGLFERQDEFVHGGAPKSQEIAKDSGVDMTAFSQCLQTPDSNTIIHRDIELGSSLDLQSTPSFYVNGHPMPGVMPVPVWTELVDRLLAAPR